MSRPSTVTCDQCRVTTALYDVAALTKAGWLEMPRKGYKRERYPWRCPKCNPMNGPKPGPGLSTPSA